MASAATVVLPAVPVVLISMSCRKISRESCLVASSICAGSAVAPQAIRVRKIAAERSMWCVLRCRRLSSANVCLRQVGAAFVWCAALNDRERGMARAVLPMRLAARLPMCASRITRSS